jgi:hypothetical protein
LLWSTSFRSRCEDALGRRPGVHNRSCRRPLAERKASMDGKSYLVRAARHARIEAELLAEIGDGAAAEALRAEIDEAETLLKNATARMRLSLRPHSVGGNGESFDRLNDEMAKLALAWEEIHGGAPVEDDGDDDDDDVAADASDSEWAEFVRSHPLAETPANRAVARQRETKESERRERASDALLERLNLSRAAVEGAFRTAIEGSPDRRTRARDVALLLAPELTDTKALGRQRVIARVGKVLGELAAEGVAVKIRPTDEYGRETCRYQLAIERVAT